MRVQVYSKSSRISTRSLEKMSTKNMMQLTQTSRSGSRNLQYASVAFATLLTNGGHNYQKEERAHDERVNTANARIKQAGMFYYCCLYTNLIFRRSNI